MIRIDLGTIGPSLNTIRTPLHELPRRLDLLIAGVMLRQQGVSEQFMRSGAPWHDRTGNARAGLHGQYGKEGDTHTLTLAHGVPYGIWLEVRFAGRYAIIGKALQAGGADVMRLLDKGMSRL